jgi:hypothetical protein
LSEAPGLRAAPTVDKPNFRIRIAVSGSTLELRWSGNLLGAIAEIVQPSSRKFVSSEAGVVRFLEELPFWVGDCRCGVRGRTGRLVVGYFEIEGASGGDVNKLVSRRFMAFWRLLALY